MSEMRILPSESIGRQFIPDTYLPEGCDEHHLRDEQSPPPEGGWRTLRADEIEALVQNGNTAASWDNVLVSEQFAPHSIKNCEFHGLVRIGRLDPVCLEYHDLTVPVGITNSRVISCDIGDDVAIHNVRYLAHYLIGDNAILLDIDEMHTSNHAKFGSGIIKEGEDEDVRVWMEPINENGGRAVMPFDGMTAGDAYLWAKHRDDPVLLERLAEITQHTFDPRRGFYGTIGDRCVIKSCRIIKDVKVGPCAYIKGANKLKNLTINSTEEEPSQIGEGVELVNGIIGRGCHVFYGCKAVRFVMGDCSNLKYGARLIHSYLGDNSTISCCEVLNDLIFPAHEQHHNNSFLIAALVKGQSNIGAGATIGSNHNSRSPDGEIEAGRGFWPGLCVSVKLFCRFASFTLLAKGDYPAELDIPLPFCLVSNDVANDRLQIMPAYWWLYNMYALARNSWKFQARDKRRQPVQHIEFDALAPDTAEEMFAALELLEAWIAKAGDGDVLAESVEHSGRDVVVLKAREGRDAYRRMLHYYAATNLVKWMEANASADLAAMCEALRGERETDWINLGGQLIPSGDIEQLKADIKSGALDSWQAVHARCDELWERYPADKARHALATLLAVLGAESLTAELWETALDEVVEIQQYVCDQTYLSRKKDFENPFRQTTFAAPAEMEAVMGSPDDNSFVAQVREETEAFAKTVEGVKTRV